MAIDYSRFGLGNQLQAPIDYSRFTLGGTAPTIGQRFPGIGFQPSSFNWSGLLKALGGGLQGLGKLDRSEPAQDTTLSQLPELDTGGLSEVLAALRQWDAERRARYRQILGL